MKRHEGLELYQLAERLHWIITWSRLLTAPVVAYFDAPLTKMSLVAMMEMF